MIALMKDSDELQMNAYCDGELDPASAIEFERRLSGDESLKARYNRLLSLRRAVRSLPQYDVPPGLQARIQSALDADRLVQAVRPGQAAAARPLPAVGGDFPLIHSTFYAPGSATGGSRLRRARCLSPSHRRGRPGGVRRSASTTSLTTDQAS